MGTLSSVSARFRRLPCFGGPEGVAERSPRTDFQVVHHRDDFISGVHFVHQFPHQPAAPRERVRDLCSPEFEQGCKHQEQIGDAVATVVEVILGGTSGIGRARTTVLLRSLPESPVQTDRYLAVAILPSISEARPPSRRQEPRWRLSGYTGTFWAMAAHRSCQRIPDPFRANAVQDLQFRKPSLQEPQRPAHVARRRLRAGRRNQFRFPVQLPRRAVHLLAPLTGLLDPPSRTLCPRLAAQPRLPMVIAVLASKIKSCSKSYFCGRHDVIGQFRVGYL